MPSEVPALDTAIGLAVVFFVLALVASAVNEVIAQAVKVRSTMLERWIQENLSPPTDRRVSAPPSPVATNTSDAVLNHPNVAGLTRNGRAPSYIPNGQFVTAVVSVGATRDRKGLPEKEAAARTTAVARKAGSTPEDIDQAVKDRVRALGGSPEGHEIAEIRREVEAAAAGLSTHQLHASIAHEIADAKAKGRRVGRRKVAKIENAVRAEAGKTSQSIERDAARQLRSAGDILQTDGSLAYETVEYSRTEIKKAIDALPHSAIRDALLHAWARAGNDMEQFRLSAEKWFDDAMQRLSGEYKRWAQKILYGIGLVLAVAVNADAFHMSSTIWRDSGIRDALVGQASNASLHAHAQNALQTLALPLGWGGTGTGLPTDWDLLWKAVGLLITTVAIGLGAPFWFDTLTRLGSLRSTGPKPPATSATTP